MTKTINQYFNTYKQLHSLKTKPFEFFPAFDKEANNKLVSQVIKANKNPMELLIWANKILDKKNG